MSRKKEAVLKAAESLTENYDREELFMPKNGRSLPNRSVIIDLVRDLQMCIRDSSKTVTNQIFQIFSAACKHFVTKGICT